MKYITKTIEGKKVDFSMEDLSFIVRDVDLERDTSKIMSFELPNVFKKLCKTADVPFEVYKKNFREMMILYIENDIRLGEYLQKGGKPVADLEYLSDGQMRIRNDAVLFPVPTGKQLPKQLVEYNRLMLRSARMEALGADDRMLEDDYKRGASKKIYDAINKDLAESAN